MKDFKYTLKRLKRKLLKPFWWRKFYIRVRITEAEALKGRCPLCQASCQAFKKNIYNFPVCQDNACPCDYNERLIIKNPKLQDEKVIR